MPVIELEPNETKRVIAERDTTLYLGQVFGASVNFGPSEYLAEEEGQKRVAGDEGEIVTGDETELFGHNLSGTETAELRLIENDPDDDDGFRFDRNPRDTIAGVLGSDGSASAPRSDDFLERQNIQVPVEADGTVVEEFEVPARADFIHVTVDEATGAHEVAIEFCDPAGNPVVTFDGDHSEEYVGDPANNSFVVVACRVFASQVRVYFGDLSSATNRLNYCVYAR